MLKVILRDTIAKQAQSVFAEFLKEYGNCSCALWLGETSCSLWPSFTRVSGVKKFEKTRSSEVSLKASDDVIAILSLEQPKPPFFPC